MLAAVDQIAPIAHRLSPIAYVYTSRLQQLALPALLLLFILVAGWYSLVIPVGEGPDEPGHVAYAFFVSSGRLPDQRVPDVPGEGHQPPLAYWLMQPAVHLVPPAQRQVVLAANPHWVWAGGDQAAAFGRRSVDRWPYHGDMLAWHALRLVSVLCGVLTVLLTWAIGRRIGLRWWTAWGAAALLAIWPQFVFHSALVSNDSLLWTLTATLLWLLLDPAPNSRWWSLGVGAVLAATLLTKQNAVILIPLVGLALWRRPTTRWRDGLIIAATTTLVAGWWYVRNIALYGDVFGLDAYKGEFVSAPFDPTRWADWSGAARALGSSLVARFGWMSLPAPAWVYGIVALVVLAALVGWVRHRPAPSPALWLLALPLLALGWTIMFAVIGGQVAWQGRFILLAAPILSCGLAAGLARLHPWALGLAIVIIASITLVLPPTLIAPAYPALTVAPQPDAPLIARWAPDDGAPFELRGLTMPDRAWVGDALHIETLWHTDGAQGRDWSLFVHLVPVNTNAVAWSWDVQPQHGAWNARRWTTGDWWRDTIDVPLPGNLPAGSYTVRLGWFDQAGDQARPGLRSLTGELQGDYYVAGTLELVAR